MITSGKFAKLGHFLSSGLHGERGVMSRQAPHLAPKTTLKELVPEVAGERKHRYSDGPTAGL